MATNRALEPEIGPDGLAREAPVIAYTEKIIEEERVQLKKYIEENYSKIPLEHMRKKIEMSTERIRIAKQKEEQTRKVQESSNSQFARLEELKRASPLSSHVSFLVILSYYTTSSSCSIQYFYGDVKAIGLTQGAATMESSSVSQTTDLRPTFSDNVPNLGNGGNVPAMNVHNKLPTNDGELKGTKKSHFHGRGKGIGAVPKGSGSTAPGWTGAGFDVDGRT
ncbi:Actin cytoskeleton-regulatory complex PAN1 [Gossypium australe]|uniref:Actin cytoskeleton-regulatory complex PAN1 n=1 Tax=Gossypium australe TaxID=47621 RepID=A0A5B6VNC5_9ROSI|nr:Actin cytoskeleton-regulatory complex PAN1 [Gossypium australe]